MEEITFKESVEERIQQYALIYTTPLFYMLAPTCFGSSLPSSESILDPSELLEILTSIQRHSEGSKKHYDEGRLLPKHVGASI
jgi:hypothetical protein